MHAVWGGRFFFREGNWNIYFQIIGFKGIATIYWLIDVYAFINSFALFSTCEIYHFDCATNKKAGLIDVEFPAMATLQFIRTWFSDQKNFITEKVRAGYSATLNMQVLVLNKVCSKPLQPLTGKAFDVQGSFLNKVRCIIVEKKNSSLLQIN